MYTWRKCAAFVYIFTFLTFLHADEPPRYRWEYSPERVFLPSGFNGVIHKGKNIRSDAHLSYYSEMSIVPQIQPHIHKAKHEVWAQLSAPFHLDILDGILDGIYSFLPPKYPTKVFVLGRGMDEDHPEIQGRVTTSSFGFEVDKVTNVMTPGREARLEHGTQIVGLMCGLMCGISKATDVTFLTLDGESGYKISETRIVEIFDRLTYYSELPKDELKIMVLADYHYASGDSFDVEITSRLLEHNVLLISHVKLLRNLPELVRSSTSGFLFVSGIYRNGTIMDGAVGDDSADVFVYTENLLVPFTNSSAAPLGYGYFTESELSVGLVAGIAAYERATDVSIKSASQLKAKIKARCQTIKSGLNGVFVSF